MPSPIQKKLIDEKELAIALGKNLKREMFMRDMSSKEVAKRANMPETYISSVLGTRTTNNADVYLKIANAIGLTDSQFQELLDQTKEQVFGVTTDGDIEYALSSELGDNEEAKRDVLFAIQVAKQKYRIKK